MKSKRTTAPTDVRLDPTLVRTLVGSPAQQAKARKHANKVRAEMAERRKSLPIRVKSFEV